MPRFYVSIFSTYLISTLPTWWNLIYHRNNPRPEGLGISRKSIHSLLLPRALPHVTCEECIPRRQSFNEHLVRMEDFYGIQHYACNLMVCSRLTITNSTIEAGESIIIRYGKWCDSIATQVGEPSKGISIKTLIKCLSNLDLFMSIDASKGKSECLSLVWKIGLHLNDVNTSIEILLWKK